MSTLQVTNIKATGETASRAVSGVAAAWVNINGASSAVRDSLNVASLVDNSAGDFRINYTSDMGNANYSIAFGGKWDTSIRVFYNGGNTNYSDPSTSFSELASFNESASAYVDPDYLWSVIHGDLA